MSNKEIKIRWVSDETEIDRSIQRLQTKMREMNKINTKLTDYSQGGSPLSKRAQYAQNQFQQTSAYMLEKESKELEKQQAKESAMLLQKQRELLKIEKIEENITEEQQKRMDMLKEEINLRSQKIMEIEGTRQDISSSIESMRGDGAPPAGGGDTPSNNKAMEMFKGILKSIGVASIINGALNFTQHRLERDRKVLADQGVTAQMSSRELREQISGQGSRGLFFAGERQRAMQMAMEEQSGQGLLDFAKIGGAIGTGAAAGAGVGSIVPGIGTAIGGVGGGILGGLGAMAGSDRMYNRIFDQDAYRQMLTREGMQKYEANRQMLELQNPLKTIAFETMQKDLDRNIMLERGLGIQGSSLYRGTDDFRMQNDFGDFDFTKAGRGAGGRGFLRDSMNPYGTNFGFEREDVDRSVQSLIQAGATSEGARGLAGRGLAFERNLRLGNAQNVMGQISGAGLGANETEQATIRLMSEAVKLGMDASKMPQEMQRMTAVTAQLATRGGGFSESAGAMFGAGLTNFSKEGFQGAASAFDEMIDRAKTAGGFEGQMGMGFLMGSGAQGAFGAKAAGKLKGNSKLMNALNQYSAIDLEQDPALAKGLADQLGISTQQLIAGMKKKDEFKQTRTASQQDATMELGKAIQGMSPEEIAEFIEGEGAGLYSRVAQEDIAAFGTTESGKGREARRASIIGRANRLAGNVSAAESDIGAGLRDKLTSDEGLSPTEINKAARATGDMARLDALNKNLDDLTRAARTHTAAAELYNEHFNKFVKYAKDSGDALEQMSTQLQQVVEMLEEEGISSGQPSE